MRPSRPSRLLIASASLAALLWCGSASAEIIDQIVARVDDQIVTTYDVRQAAVPFLLQEGLSPEVLEDEERRDTIYRQVLRDLVDRKLLAQEAARADITIGDDELDRWLEFTRQQQNMDEAQFRQAIEQYGMEYDVYREMVRQNLLKIRMIKIKVGSQVTITEDDVEQLYQERYGDNAQQRYLTISHILVRPEGDSAEAVRAARAEAEALRAQLDEGAGFAELAKKASDGPAADKGGTLGTFRRGELDPEFENAAFGLEEGTYSPVTRTKFGFHIIRVDDVELRASPDVDARKEAIRGELQQKEMERLLDQYLQNLRHRAFVEIEEI